MTNREVPNFEIKQAVCKQLNERGVKVKDIAQIVYELQSPYNDITIEECIDSINAVLDKRELCHAILVGIELDRLAEKHLLSEPLQSIIEHDEPLFGTDEIIAIGSVFGYGSIAITNYGFLDKEKTGIIRELDTSKNRVNTFLDDLVASIAAGAAARLAHHKRDEKEAVLYGKV